MKIFTLFIAFFISVSVDGLTDIKNEGENTCERPSIIYIPWHKVRRYLNHNLKASIPAPINAPPLPVRRCSHLLAPCSIGFESCCAVSTEKYVVRELPLSIVDGDVTRDSQKRLRILFVEHENCTCVNNSRYSRIKVVINSVPPIIDTEIVKKKR